MRHDLVLSREIISEIGRLGSDSDSEEAEARQGMTESGNAGHVNQSEEDDGQRSGSSASDERRMMKGRLEGVRSAIDHLAAASSSVAPSAAQAATHQRLSAPAAATTTTRPSPAAHPTSAAAAAARLPPGTPPAIGSVIEDFASRLSHIEELYSDMTGNLGRVDGRLVSQARSVRDLQHISADAINETARLAEYLGSTNAAAKLPLGVRPTSYTPPPRRTAAAIVPPVMPTSARQYRQYQPYDLSPGAAQHSTLYAAADPAAIAAAAAAGSPQSADDAALLGATVQQHASQIYRLTAGLDFLEQHIIRQDLAVATVQRDVLAAMHAQGDTAPSELSMRMHDMHEVLQAMRSQLTKAEKAATTSTSGIQALALRVDQLSATVRQTPLAPHLEEAVRALSRELEALRQHVESDDTARGSTRAAEAAAAAAAESTALRQQMSSLASTVADLVDQNTHLREAAQRSEAQVAAAVGEAVQAATAAGQEAAQAAAAAASAAQQAAEAMAAAQASAGDRGRGDVPSACGATAEEVQLLRDELAAARRAIQEQGTAVQAMSEQQQSLAAAAAVSGGSGSRGDNSTLSGPRTVVRLRDLSRVTGGIEALVASVQAQSLGHFEQLQAALDESTAARNALQEQLDSVTSSLRDVAAQQTQGVVDATELQSDLRERIDAVLARIQERVQDNVQQMSLQLNSMQQQLDGSLRAEDLAQALAGGAAAPLEARLERKLQQTAQQLLAAATAMQSELLAGQLEAATVRMSEDLAGQLAGQMAATSGESLQACLAAVDDGVSDLRRAVMVLEEQAGRERDSVAAAQSALETELRAELSRLGEQLRDTLLATDAVRDDAAAAQVEGLRAELAGRVKEEVGASRAAVQQELGDLVEEVRLLTAALEALASEVLPAGDIKAMEEELAVVREDLVALRGELATDRVAAEDHVAGLLDHLQGTVTHSDLSLLADDQRALKEATARLIMELDDIKGRTADLALHTTTSAAAAAAVAAAATAEATSATAAVEEVGCRVDALLLKVSLAKSEAAEAHACATAVSRRPDAADVVEGAMQGWRVELSDALTDLRAAVAAEFISREQLSAVFAARDDMKRSLDHMAAAFAPGDREGSGSAFSTPVRRGPATHSTPAAAPASSALLERLVMRVDEQAEVLKVQAGQLEVQAAQLASLLAQAAAAEGSEAGVAASQAANGIGGEDSYAAPQYDLRAVVSESQVFGQPDARASNGHIAGPDEAAAPSASRALRKVKSMAGRYTTSSSTRDAELASIKTALQELQVLVLEVRSTHTFRRDLYLDHIPSPIRGDSGVHSHGHEDSPYSPSTQLLHAQQQSRYSNQDDSNLSAALAHLKQDVNAAVSRLDARLDAAESAAAESAAVSRSATDQVVRELSDVYNTVSKAQATVINLQNSVAEIKDTVTDVQDTTRIALEGLWERLDASSPAAGGGAADESSPRASRSEVHAVQEEVAAVIARLQALGLSYRLEELSALQEDLEALTNVVTKLSADRQQQTQQQLQPPPEQYSQLYTLPPVAAAELAQLRDDVSALQSQVTKLTSASGVRASDAGGAEPSAGAAAGGTVVAAAVVAAEDELLDQPLSVGALARRQEEDHAVLVSSVAGLQRAVSAALARLDARIDATVHAANDYALLHQQPRRVSTSSSPEPPHEQAGQPRSRQSMDGHDESSDANVQLSIGGLARRQEEDHAVLVSSVAGLQRAVSASLARLDARIDSASHAAIDNSALLQQSPPPGAPSTRPSTDGGAANADELSVRALARRQEEDHAVLVSSVAGLQRAVSASLARLDARIDTASHAASDSAHLHSHQPPPPPHPPVMHNTSEQGADEHTAADGEAIVPTASAAVAQRQQEDHALLVLVVSAVAGLQRVVTESLVRLDARIDSAAHAASDYALLHHTNPNASPTPAASARQSMDGHDAGSATALVATMAQRQQEDHALLVSAVAGLQRAVTESLARLDARIDGTLQASGSSSQAVVDLEATAEHLSSEVASLQEWLLRLDGRTDSLAAAQQLQHSSSTRRSHISSSQAPGEDRPAVAEVDLTETLAAEVAALQQSFLRLDARMEDCSSSVEEAATQAAGRAAEVDAALERLEARVDVCTSSIDDAATQAAGLAAEVDAALERLEVRVTGPSSTWDEAYRQVTLLTQQLPFLQQDNTASQEELAHLKNWVENLASAHSQTLEVCTSFERRVEELATAPPATATQAGSSSKEMTAVIEDLNERQLELEAKMQTLTEMQNLALEMARNTSSVPPGLADAVQQQHDELADLVKSVMERQETTASALADLNAKLQAVAASAALSAEATAAAAAVSEVVRALEEAVASQRDALTSIAEVVATKATETLAADVAALQSQVAALETQGTDLRQASLSSMDAFRSLQAAMSSGRTASETAGGTVEIDGDSETPVTSGHVRKLEDRLEAVISRLQVLSLGSRMQQLTELQAQVANLEEHSSRLMEDTTHLREQAFNISAREDTLESRLLQECDSRNALSARVAHLESLTAPRSLQHSESGGLSATEASSHGGGGDGSSGGGGVSQVVGAQLQEHGAALAALRNRIQSMQDLLDAHSGGIAELASAADVQAVASRLDRAETGATQVTARVADLAASLPVLASGLRSVQGKVHSRLDAGLRGLETLSQQLRDMQKTERPSSLNPFTALGNAVNNPLIVAVESKFDALRSSLLATVTVLIDDLHAERNERGNETAVAAQLMDVV